MVIDKKIAYVKKKELFEPLIPTIPTGLNPIVFIEDTREMWTCGTYFSIGYPSIEVSEESGSIKVTIGNSFFMMSTTGESISVRKGDGNRIILSSNALNRVDTDVPLEWVTADRKLIHKKSGTNAGTFGQSTNVNNASIFSIPNVTVDEWGHVTDIANRNVSIRDYVEQLTPSTSIGERNVLLAYSDMDVSESAQVRKANGMSYNDATKKLILTGGLNSTGAVNVVGSDLTVIDGYIIGKLKGDVEGSATPKIHLSLKPEYGGSSLELYGHVKLQDTLNSKPNPSTSNTNINNTEITAIAASPLMVWNAIETAKAYADSILGANNAMLYKGALEAGLSTPGTYTPAADIGNTYVVTFGSGNYIDNVGYINGEPVEVGDLLICKVATPASTSSTWNDIKNNWTYVQTNTTGVVSGPSSSVMGQLAVFNSATGKLIKGLNNGNLGQMLVIGDAGIPKWEDKPDRLNHKLRFRYNLVDFLSFDGYEDKTINFIAGDNVFISVDEQGNITLAADPGSDTVNTAGATNLINKKLFLIGAESQTTSPETYSNQYVYVGTDNCLYSGGTKVSVEGHTHLYAGSLTPGGAALKIDLNPTGLLNATEGSYGGILQDSTNGPVSSMWSNRLKILHANSSGYYTELAQAMTGTEGLWHRRNTGGTLTDWVALIDKNNFHTYLDDTYIQKATDPNQLKNFVRYSIESGLTMNWVSGNETPTHIWGHKGGDSSMAYVFNGDNIRAFANAVNRAGDTMTGALKVTEIQATNGNGLVMWNGTDYTYLGMQAGTTYIRSGETDLQHRKNGVDYKIWDTSNLTDLRTEHYHNYIASIDSRDVVSTPQEHFSGVYLDFKSNANAGLNDGGSYTGLLTVRKYGSTTDWSGGPATQLGFTDNSNLWLRTGSGTSWDAWIKVWTSANLTGTQTAHTHNFYDLVNTIVASNEFNFVPTRYTGGDIVINHYPMKDRTPLTTPITSYHFRNGAAGYSNVTSSGFIKSGSSDNYVLLGGAGHKALDLLIQVDRGGGINNRSNAGTNQAWFDYNFGGSGAAGSAISFTGLGNYATQIMGSYNSSVGDLKFRTHNGDANAWNAVRTIWHDGNLTGAQTAHYHNWLPTRSITNLDTPNWNNGGLTMDLYAVGASNAPYLSNNANNVLNVSSTNHGSSGQYGYQLAHSNGSNRLYFRQWSYGVRGAWEALAYSSDVNTKVSKAGDVMTGLLHINTYGTDLVIGAQNSSFVHIYNNGNASPFIFNKSVYAIGDFYGGSGYNRRLAYVDEILSQVGGSKSAQASWASWGTGTYDGAIQIRETSYVTSNQSAWGYSPAISFHWGNRYVKRFGMRSDGQFAVDDVPISLSTHNHDTSYVRKSGDSMTGQLIIQSAGMNGQYNGLLVGDDCYIGDCNIGNTIGLMGSTNNNAGMLKFGKGGYQFGYNGSNHFVSGTGQWTNLNADLLDGEHNGNLTANYYNANSQQTLALSGYDQNTWYPCVLYAHPGNSTPVRVTFCNALSSNVPSWSTHGDGFSFQWDFEWIGGGWGTIPWYFRNYTHRASFGGETCCYGVEQRNNRSALVIYLRGGGNYQYRTTDGRSFTVYTSNTNIGDGTYPDYVAPRTSRLNNEWEMESNSRYGTCRIASLADRATVTDHATYADYLSPYGESNGNHITSHGTSAWTYNMWDGTSNGIPAPYMSGIGIRAADNNYGWQIGNTAFTENLWFRYFHGGGYGTWKALATTEDVANVIPSGTIIMWLGTDIPSGWEDITSLFDGRFPMGAGTARSTGWGTSIKSTYYAGVNSTGGEDYVQVDGDYLPNHYHRFVNGTNNYWGGTYTEGKSDDEFKKISSLSGHHGRGHDSGERTEQGVFRTGSKCNVNGYNYNSSTYAYFTLIPKFRAVKFLRKL